MGFRYGTYDHLMLLLGRLANFSSKDQSRKRRASRGKFAPQGSGSPPPFPGMLPTLGKVKPPMGFTPPRDPSPQSDILEDTDPEASFQSALQEWEAIRLAFDAFETQLGPEFQPLRPEYSDRRDSPFGMTLQYRTFSVAGLWMNFYMGMIHLHRAHPTMPPAAMQAAGVSARQTAGFANQVGRVAAGLSDDCSQVTEISTLVSAAFIESCFCLFVAGVQVFDHPRLCLIVDWLMVIFSIKMMLSATGSFAECTTSPGSRAGNLPSRLQMVASQVGSKQRKSDMGHLTFERQIWVWTFRHPCSRIRVVSTGSCESSNQMRRSPWFLQSPNAPIMLWG